MGKTQQSANGRATARPGSARKGGVSRAAQAGGRSGPPGNGGPDGQNPSGQNRARPESRQRPEGGRPPGPGGGRQHRAPPVVPLATFALSLVGLGLSIYLTITHLHPAALFCSDKGLVNCNAVTTSTQSKVFGIFPVAELGLAYYVFTSRDQLALGLADELRRRRI